MSQLGEVGMVRTIQNGLKPFIEKPDWLGKVTPQTLLKDAFAGLTVASIVLPQGVAFAAIAGLPPEYGFYTAMVTPVITAFYGSSWHAVSGPTTAISALAFGTLSGTLVPGSPEFISAAIVLAFLVGLMQIAFGLVRLGRLVDFVSHSVMVGFMAVAPHHPQTQGKIERWHQTLKNRSLLENYFLPDDLERQISAFVDHYNNHRYHEGLANLTPADVYHGQGANLLKMREEIKKQTIRKRKLQHQAAAA